MNQGWVVLALLAAAGCTSGGVPAAQRQGGSLGIAANGQLFVAAMDNGAVAVVDPASTSGAQAIIPTGDRPERLIVRGNTVFVANRQSRTVTQIDATTRQVVRQIAVGAEPMGMDTMKDGTLLVANAMSGTVQAINPNDGSTKWTADLGEQVRAVAALPNGKIYVPSYKEGTIHVLDGSGHRVNTEIAMQQPVSDPARTRRLRAVEHILVNPLDERAYLPHSASLDAPLPPAVTGYYSRPPPTFDFTGGVSAAPIAPAITTVDSGTHVLLQTSDERQDFPPPVFTTGSSGLSSNSFAGPKTAILDQSADFLYVVNQLSNNVAQISTHRRGVDGDYAGQGVKQLIPVGQGPDGIAFSNDNKFLYVNNAFDHSISVIAYSEKDGLLTEQRRILNVTPQTLTREQQVGRILFHAAGDPRVSAQGFGGVSCASCHPGGREDGHTWHFAEGARNTPALVGRGLASTGPYHWDGALKTPESFAHVVQVRMGGSGLTPDEYKDIFKWLESEAGPDNPNRLPAENLTPEQQQLKDLQDRGHTVFVNANCGSCHTATNNLFTDDKNYDVGTDFTTADIDIISVTGLVRPDQIQPADPNTPSLLGVFASGPYLHDGKFKTLEERLRSNPNGRHGSTADLTDDDMKALTAYVKSL